MPRPTDAVTKGCVDNNKNCKLTAKCDICIKEIKDLDEIETVLIGAIKSSEMALQSLTPGVKKQRGRPKLIVKTDIKIIQGPITVAFD